MLGSPTGTRPRRWTAQRPQRHGQRAAARSRTARSWGRARRSYAWYSRCVTTRPVWVTYKYALILCACISVDRPSNTMATRAPNTHPETETVACRERRRPHPPHPQIRQAEQLAGPLRRWAHRAGGGQRECGAGVSPPCMRLVRYSLGRPESQGALALDRRLPSFAVDLLVCSAQMWASGALAFSRRGDALGQHPPLSSTP